MQGKKKYIALILFLIIGLTIFTFANSNDENNTLSGNTNKEQEITNTNPAPSDDKQEEIENNKGNSYRPNNKNENDNNMGVGGITPGTGDSVEVDQNYTLALMAVKNAENTLALEDIESARKLIAKVKDEILNAELTSLINEIDATRLVKDLEVKLENAKTKSTILESKKIIDDARKYYQDNEVRNQVDALESSAEKTALEKRLVDVEKILNDVTAPQLDGIAEGMHTNTKVMIKPIDANAVTIVEVTLNGNEVEKAESYDEEGLYKVSLVDAAYNDITLSFTIDKTKAEISKVGIANLSGLNLEYAKAGDVISVYVEANEKLLEPVIKINGKQAQIKNENQTKYVGEVTLTNEMTEGKITFTIENVRDLAGNELDNLTDENITEGPLGITFDKTSPEITIKDSSVNNVENYKTIDLKLFDANKIVEVDINGNKLTFDIENVEINDGMEYTFEEGTNIVKVMDSAGNISELTVIKDNSVFVTSIEELKDAFANGGEYKLSQDLSLDATSADSWLTVPAGVKLTLNLNGKTISNESDVKPNKLIVVLGELIITGNGTLDATNTVYERIMQTEENGIIKAMDGNYIGQITAYDNGVTSLFGGTYRPVIYNPDDYFNNAKGTLNKTWDGGTVVAYGGTYIGMNPAWGDEGMAYGGPNYDPNGYCQGLFLKGQQRNDGSIPEGYEIIEGITSDNIPTYTVNYTEDTKAPTAVTNTLSPETETDDVVLVTIKLNETVKEVKDGWTLSLDRMSISKEFKKNATGTVAVTDLAGNTGNISYTVSNIIPKQHSVRTFEELENALSVGGIITIENNITLTKTMTLSYDVDVVLNLNGKTLSVDAVQGFNGETLIDMVRGEDRTIDSSLVITGNGTIDLGDYTKASILFPRGDVTIENGNFLRNPNPTVPLDDWAPMFTGMNGKTTTFTINGGYFDGGFYEEGNTFENCRRLLNKSYGGTYRVNGGTFVGQNVALGDEGTGYQGFFFAGQTNDDKTLPAGFSVVEGALADGRPTFTVNYNA